MRKWLAALLLLILAFPLLTSITQAQEAPSFSTLRVSLWPEYDQPDLLVIYRFTLSNTASLPTNITLTIPTSAGDPHAVAVGAREDMVGDVPYTRVVRGNWAEISFIATMPSVQFEYYDPALQRNGEQRSITYQWPGDYAVEAMVVEVQQPLQATDMRISPSLGTSQTRTDGLVYYVADVGALNADQTFRISIDYQKSTERLTAEQLVVQPSEPLVQDTSAVLPSGGIWPIALGFLGLALIIGGGIWYWQSGTRDVSSKTGKRRPRNVKTQPPKIEAGSGIYCHQCGKRANANDRFCRSCGIRLRLE